VAAKPRNCKAEKPVNILRAVIAAGGLKQAGPRGRLDLDVIDQARRDAALEKPLLGQVLVTLDESYYGPLSAARHYGWALLDPPLKEAADPADDTVGKPGTCWITWRWRAAECVATARQKIADAERSLVRGSGIARALYERDGGDELVRRIDAARELVSSITRAGARWLPRSKRWSPDQREDRRAAKDKVFARQLKRRRAQAARLAAREAAQKQHLRNLVLHIADRWHHTERRLYTSKYADITWGRGVRQNLEWDRYAKSYKFPCKYRDAGAGLMDDGRVVLSPVSGHEIFLPPIPPAMRRAWAQSEPHPVGLFAVPVKGQAGVFACMTARSGDTKWSVAGFCVAGHRVPECVARGMITLADITAEANAETQRIMIERFGYGRYLSESGATEIQSDDFGRLYELPGGTKLARLLNSTPNADGTVNEYFLPVPSTVKTAHEAVAWSFGLTTETYRPAVQS
jgi:hypothetical protein